MITTKSLAEDLDVQGLTPIQGLAAWLVVGVLILIVVATGLIGWIVFVATSLPAVAQPPSTPSTETVAFYKQLADLYKQFSDVQLARFTQLFQLVVVTALLPVLTLLLGYLFGKQTK